MLPNLKWIPSTSPNPGADHQVYWGTVLPVDHDFWSSHRPGDRWNCKCTLEATVEPATGVPLDNVPSAAPQSGLKDNPGKSLKLFDESHPYFPSDCSSCPFNSGIKGKVRTIFKARKKDCCNCQQINSKIPDPEMEHRKAAKARYKELLNDPEYKDVRFDKKSGGIMATHVGHITHDGPKAERFFKEGLTSTQLEKECQELLSKWGHTAILLDESKRIKGKQLAAMDLELDGEKMDIRSVTGNGWYSNIFVAKNKQLHKYNLREDVSEESSAVCLYFYDAKLFNETKLNKSISYFKHYRDNDGKLLKRAVKKVFCVINGRSNVLIYDIK